MRRPRNRQRKVVVTDELVELFRKALAVDQALDRDRDRAKPLMTLEQDKQALAAVHAFYKAANVPLWERFSPLHPRATDAELQSALVARLPADERKAWQRYVDRCQKQNDADRKREITPARRKQREKAALPRSDNLRWGSGW